MTSFSICVCTLSLGTLATMTGVAHSQIKKVLPSSVTNLDGSGSTPYFSGYGAGRAQQVLLGANLAKTTAVIREIALRADLGPSVAARSFTMIRFWIGITSKSPSTMSANFAANRTGAQKLVFAKAMTLPAQTAATQPFNIRWKLAAPYFYRPADGNLLLEWEVPGQPTKAQYFLDTHADSMTSGSFQAYGAAGQFKANGKYIVTCPNPGALIPGGRVEFITGNFKTKYPAIVSWGFSDKLYRALKLPFDLTGLGAPGNAVNCSIDLALPLVMQAGRGGWEARSALPIPNHPAFNGFQVYAQAIFVDSSSNRLGLVFSQGLALTLSRDATGTLLGHYDVNSPTGFMRARTGMVVEFTGIFN